MLLRHSPAQCLFKRITELWPPYVTILSRLKEFVIVRIQTCSPQIPEYTTELFIFTSHKLSAPIAIKLRMTPPVSPGIQVPCSTT